MPKSYDPGKVTLNFSGIPMTGFYAGTFITVARDNDTVKDYVGSQGDVTIVQNRDKRGSITFVLDQSSASNDVLSTFHNTLESDPFVAPASVVDTSGSTICAGGKCWITKPADTTYADAESLESRTWVIRTDYLEMFVGGNPEAAEA